MPSYREIEDVVEIRRASNELNRRIRHFAPHAVTKSVGYPSGNQDFPIRFAAKAGADVLWWSSSPARNDDVIVNLIGRGDPESNSFLLIDLQFNVPTETFRRSLGGAFVREEKSGQVLLAHRGIVTRGNARVSKVALLRHTDAKMTQVATSSGVIDLFLVAALDSPDLLGNIARFAQDIRHAADTAAVEGTTKASKKNRSGAKRASDSGADDLDAKLSAYFDEFVGKRRLPARAEVIVSVRHGDVVRALKDRLQGKGGIRKSGGIDLVLLTSKAVIVFEVKTGTDTTSLYTAVGQVCLHSLMLAAYHRDRKVKRVLVLPVSASRGVRDSLMRELGIDVITYEWISRRRPVFDADSWARLEALAR